MLELAVAVHNLVAEVDINATADPTFAASDQTETQK
jgi:hypothetical protein